MAYLIHYWKSNGLQKGVSEQKVVRIKSIEEASLFSPEDIPPETVLITLTETKTEKVIWTKPND